MNHEDRRSNNNSRASPDIIVNAIDGTESTTEDVGGDDSGQHQNLVTSNSMEEIIPNQAMNITTSNESADDYTDGDDYDDEYDDLSSSQRHLRWTRSITRNSGDSSGGNNQQQYEYDYLDEDGRAVWFIYMPSMKVRVLFGIFILISILAIFIPKQKDTEENPVVRKFKGSPQYTCPKITTTSSIDGSITSTSTSFSSSKTNTIITPGHVFIDYVNNSLFMNEYYHNISLYDYHNEQYMDWNKTYNEIKEGIRHWKISKFLPNLKTGDSIFDSGCGIGLSLLMTLEILQEESNKNLRDLHLYGTDFGILSANMANTLLDTVLDHNEGKRGIVCTADSTNLHFIPNDSFDLVYSTRISPKPDPWKDNDNENINEEQQSIGYTTIDSGIERRKELCIDDNDWKSQTLLEVAQELQYNWYGYWVKEMIRIAKPGSPIIIEYVTDPFCNTQQVPDEWGGGVPYSFWHNAITAYQWDDLDPDSIEFESDTLFQKNRYHVFMRKK